MVELARVVRFFVSPGDTRGHGREGRNTFAGWPGPAGIGAFYEIELRCRGETDPITGYLINISEIDKWVRSSCAPVIAAALVGAPNQHPSHLLPALLGALPESIRTLVHSMTWHLSPYHAVRMTKSNSAEVELSEVFEFAAAHRLNCRGLSEAQNRELFGKCNNPSGHGHNYRIEVTISIPVDQEEDSRFDHVALERIVDDFVIRRFDHKNLDVDTVEFRDRNSSVENIARSCYELLQQPLTNAGARLRRVRVWETEKTSCTYPAGA
jgi:6-pyruvoyltetrahydropterin/6-carboxytetrahydropterin synthase